MMAFNADINVGNVIANLIMLGGPVWYFGSKYLKKREETEKILFEKHEKEIEKREANEKEVRRELVETAANVARQLEERHNAATTQIMGKIADNRQFYSDSYGQIKNSIDALANHVAIANGRTATLESTVKAVVARCEERSKAFYNPGVTERRHEAQGG
jgi:hypothetical protein